MIRPLRFIPDNVSVPFMQFRVFGYVFSIAVTLISIFLLFTPGLNFGIDFKGGILMEIREPQVVNVEELRTTLDGMELGQLTLQQFNQPTDIMIRIPQQPDGEAGNLRAIDKVKETLGSEVEYRRVEFVGPQVGGELIRTSTWATILALGGILLYIWFRFDWQYGVATVIALAHDIIATLGLLVLTRIDFDLTTVAAVLLISGYSLNDTVVVFDRVRENLRKYKKMDMATLLNNSMNETLYRTMMTSGTTLLVLTSLYLFGGEVIRSFSIALIFGILVGTYSSVFVATPLLMMMQPRREAKTTPVPQAS